MSAHAYMSAYMEEYVYYAQDLWLCWQVCACSTYSCYLLCCVMVGMCLAAASWQSQNGSLATLPPSQPVAGLRLHHLQLLHAVAQLWCLMVGMRLAAVSWQSKNCLLRYSRSKLPILTKMCCLVAVLWWSGPFRSRPRSIPFHTRSRPGPPIYHPWPTPGWTNGRFSHRLLLMSFKSRRWDLRDKSEAERIASHGIQWVTLATSCVTRQTCVEQVYNKDVVQMTWKWAAASVSSFNMHILEMFFIHIYTAYIIYIFLFIYNFLFIFIYLYAFLYLYLHLNSYLFICLFVHVVLIIIFYLFMFLFVYSFM